MKKTYELAFVSASDDEVVAWLQRVLVPLASGIEAARERGASHVVVVLNPGKQTNWWVKRNFSLKARATMVFGLESASARRLANEAYAHDPITKKWLRRFPADDETPIFLCAGEGSALLTLRCGPDGDARIHVEPQDSPFVH